MKISGFTFIRNGQRLGYPFIQSINSILPIVDEFVVNVGNSTDNTLQMIKAINSPKIKIIETTWNENIKTKGFVYAQQKMIAQYSCTGDWAFYLEGDELVHEQDYSAIVAAMEKHLHNPKVEALAFDYLHFYGNTCTYAWSPAWYRREARIIKTTVRNYAPDGLYWVVLAKNKKGRYPRAALANATIYHYGWIRTEDEMIDKISHVEHYWNQENNAKEFSYAKIDAQTLRLFTGTHPLVLDNFFPTAKELFKADPNHILTKRERKNRIGLKLEKLLGLELSKKHFTLIE